MKLELLPILEQTPRHLPKKPLAETRCGIVASNSWEANGQVCGSLKLLGPCETCGTPMCGACAETCPNCGHNFCGSCLGFHGHTIVNLQEMVEKVMR